MRQSEEQPARISEEKVAYGLASFGVAATPLLAGRIADYHHLLLQWNRKISLTTVPESEILPRHFGESLFGAKVAGIERGHLLDVGSGAGFPGLVIALAHPGIQAVLLEPSGKKAAFLAEAARKLALTDRVLISRTRLEDYRAVAAGCDFITSRAVRIEEPFLESCRRLLTPKGKLVLWQSEEDFVDLREIGGWNWAGPIRIPLSERRLVVWGRPIAAEGVSRETEG
jgi:16S rRNA (guanine527-N7)-methyltransferase